MNFRILIPLLILLTTPLLAQPAIEFNGVVVSGGKTRVSLLDPATGQAGWVTIGGRFGDYILAAYIPAAPSPAIGSTKADAVVLKRASDGQLMPPIGLKDAFQPESSPSDRTDPESGPPAGDGS